MPSSEPASRRRLLLLALTTGAWSLAAPIALPPARAQEPTRIPPSPARLRIGYQRSALNLLVLRERGTLAQRLPQTQISWTEFAAGPPLLDALAAGDIDFGLTGNAPPVFAQAAGQDVVYVGAEPPQPDSTAVLVPWRSRIRDVAGLRGQRVAVQKGSSTQVLLLRVLEQAGLRWSDIVPVYLPPLEARAAFEARRVDAWAIGDPHYAAAELALGPRVLATGHGLAGPSAFWDFYLASRALVTLHAATIAVVFEELARADRFVQERRLDATTLIAQATAQDPRVVQQLLRRRPPSPVAPLTPQAVTEQQRIADTFLRLGLIPQPLRVADVVWSATAVPMAARTRN